jgi:hypothetical protein
VDKKINNDLKMRQLILLAQDLDKFELSFLLETLNNVNIQDVWEQSGTAVLYWLYIANDIRQDSETLFIKELLFWQACYAKSDAKVSCLTNDNSRLYDCCIKHFKPSSVPCLILSATPHFETVELFYVPDFVLIRKRPIIPFLNQILNYLRMGKDLNEIRLLIAPFLTENNLDKSALKNLLQRGNLSEVIKKLENFIKIGRGHEKEADFIHYASAYNRLEKERNHNTINPADYQVSSARISANFIALIDEINC